MKKCIHKVICWFKRTFFKKKNPRTLYIIGNGFDLYHKLETRYQHFALYLLKKNNALYDNLLKYYNLPDLDPDDPDSLYNELWSNFEACLANLDAEELLQEFSDYMPNYASDDFREGDRYAYQWEVESIVNMLTIEMCQNFKQFIIAVIYPPLLKRNRLNIDNCPSFLNFNYTNSLERYYKVPQNKIVYIHGNAATDESVILGHGIDPNEFKKEEPKPPENATEEEMNRWEEFMADSYDYSFDLAEQQTLSYFKDSYKATAEIIEKNRSFFEGLKDIEKIVVLGHSISEVDQPYFRKVIACVNADTEWFVSYYDDKEKAKHTNTMKSLGIDDSKLHLITMNEL